MKGLKATEHWADVAGSDPAAELVRLREENASLREREAAAAGYVRAKIDQLLQVMGTLPLHPEELDDATLFALDPIGILSDAFAQVLEHSQKTNEALAVARDEISAILDSAGAAILVVDSEGRIQNRNSRSRELFFPSQEAVIGRSCREMICRRPVAPVTCLLDRISRHGGRAEDEDFTLDGKHFHVVATPLHDRQGVVSRVVLVYTDFTQRRRMEQSLLEAEARLRTILTSVQAGILLIEAESHRIVDVNDLGLRMIGAPREAVLGAECHRFVCAVTCGECPITELGQTVDSADRWLLTANGGRLPVLKTVTKIMLDGRMHLLESFVDLSERKQAEAALQASEQKYRTLYAAMKEGVSLNELVHDAAGCPVDFRIIDVNPAYESIFNLPRQAVLGRLASEIYPEPVSSHLDIYIRVVESGQPVSFESSYEPLQKTFHVSAFAPAEGRFATVFEDITERKRAEVEVQRLAYFDSLTGLPNRSLFRDRLEQALAHAGRAGHRVALMFLDLDQFKEVNDTLGHATGDHLLKMVADRLGNSVRKSDTVARIGGDEFVVILTDVEGEVDVSAAASKLLSAIAVPAQVEGREMFITGSLGIALFPEDGETAETLIKNADAAMYQAKEHGDTHQFYTTAMNALALERLLLGNDLRRALERNEFFLVYQPQVNIDSGRMTGMEALLRWRHPDLGLLPPSQFIPLAEETGLILPIGRWVLETACAQNRAWQQAGFPPLMVAVNLSGRQFREGGVAEMVAEVLAATGMPAHLLELEITETVLMDNAETTRRTLNELKAMGLQLAIDDFGTGYSSLSYLKHFPIDRLKIDRSFVHDITRHDDDAAIAEAIIAMGHSLRLKIVAEGVETLEQVEFLRARGCDEMQGFFFRRPETLEDFTGMLQHGLGNDQICLFSG